MTTRVLFAALPLTEDLVMDQFRPTVRLFVLMHLILTPRFSAWSQSPSDPPLYTCEGHGVAPTSRTSPKHGDYDCGERVDTGYVNGESFSIIVVTVDGEPAERESANAYWMMKRAALLDGIDLHISSGFRTWAEQDYFYQCYLNQNCNNGNLAAPPGYSNHQSGHAFDLNTSTEGVLTWLNSNGARFGFERTVSSEPWHWEWWGGGPGGGPCQGQPCPVIGEGGGVLDDSGPCFQKFGNATYWRQVSDEGEGGGLHWTNAFDATSPGNWARWNMHFSEAGEYLVEVSVSTQYGICAQTPYGVKHAGGEVAITLDQSSPEHWQTLGVFNFDVGSGFYVDVYDHIPGWSLQDQHITADAVRLTRQRAPHPDPEPEYDPTGTEVQPDSTLNGEEVSSAGDSAGAETLNGGENLSFNGGDIDHEVGGDLETAGADIQVGDPDRLTEGNRDREGEDVEESETQDQHNTERDERPYQGQMSCAQMTLRSGTPTSAPLGPYWQLSLFSLVGSLLITRIRHNLMLRLKPSSIFTSSINAQQRE